MHDIFRRLGMFTAGILVMSYGICLIISAGLGVLPWDVFHIGLSNHTPLTTGVAMQITGAVLVGITVVLTGKWPQIGTILNMILVGLFVDLYFFLDIVPAVSSLPYKYLILSAGILAFGFGAGMYISPKLGAGPRDAINLVLADKTRFSIRAVKTMLEVGALISGYLLGGPVGIGTVITSFTIGFVFQFSVIFWRKIFETFITSKAVLPENRLHST